MPTIEEEFADAVRTLVRLVKKVGAQGRLDIHKTDPFGDEIGESMRIDMHKDNEEGELEDGHFVGVTIKLRGLENLGLDQFAEDEGWRRSELCW